MEDEFSEGLFREMADMMVVGGYQAAGYNTVIVDDCWLAKDRDKVCASCIVFISNRTIPSAL